MFGKTHSFLPTRKWNSPKHRAYFAPFGDRLQPAVLLLELFHLTGLISLHTNVLLLPSIEVCPLIPILRITSATVHPAWPATAQQQSAPQKNAPSSCTVSLQILPKTNISTGPEIPEPITGTYI
jgi:hypothetical protein